MGVLAAVNEEVEWSYRFNIGLVLLTVFVLSFLTYRSVIASLIVMIPSIVAQPLSEAVMYLGGIDLNIQSLPVAAIGIGIGIDYGYYVLSRIVEELCAGEGFDVVIHLDVEQVAALHEVPRRYGRLGERLRAGGSPARL